MYNNGSNQQRSMAAGQFIPQFQTQFWGPQNETDGGIAAIGQRPFHGENNGMVPMDNYYQTMGGVGPMKRAFREDQNGDGGREGTVEEEKENQQPKAKRIHLAPTESAEKRRHNDGAQDDREGEEEEDEGEEEEEKEEEEEEESNRSTKSSSSAENEEPLGSYSSVAMQQQSQHSPNLMVTPHQRTLPTPTSIGNPLAHSTPYFGTFSLNSFPQQPLDYLGGMALQQMSSHLALVATNKNIAASGGAFVPSHHPLGHLTPSSSAYYSNPYGQQTQNLMAPYGGGTANGAAFSQRTQGYQHIPQHNLSTNLTYQSRDSGVGSVKAEMKDEGRNETKSSSTSGGSDESGSSGSAIGQNWMTMPETKFPPFFHMTANGQQIDLETIAFETVPARLALLNCNKKHTITLAEIYRRLGWPEHLNTSYLSGILRKAKNTNAGKALRNRLNGLGYGIDLRTGRRKQTPVTTFTTLCEREAIQMADDFAKLASESFPTEQIALEMNRRAAVKCPKDAHQRLTYVKNTSHILHEAIRILQQGIDNETLPIVSPSQAQLMEPSADRTVLLQRTLNDVKNFSRLSHCFGNRTVIVAWKTLLNVFEKCEENLGESLNEVGPFPGTSAKATIGIAEKQ